MSLHQQTYRKSLDRITKILSRKIPSMDEINFAIEEAVGTGGRTTYGQALNAVRAQNIGREEKLYDVITKSATAALSRKYKAAKYSRDEAAGVRAEEKHRSDMDYRPIERGMEIAAAARAELEFQMKLEAGHYKKGQRPTVESRAAAEEAREAAAAWRAAGEYEYGVTQRPDEEARVAAETLREAEDYARKVAGIPVETARQKVKDAQAAAKEQRDVDKSEQAIRLNELEAVRAGEKHELAMAAARTKKEEDAATLKFKKEQQRLQGEKIKLQIENQRLLRLQRAREARKLETEREGAPMAALGKAIDSLVPQKDRASIYPFINLDGLTTGNAAGRVASAVDEAKKHGSISPIELDNTYQKGGGVYNKDNDFIGYSVFNRNTGEWLVMDIDGNLSPIPPGSRKIDAGVMSKIVMRAETFQKLQDKVTQVKLTKTQIERYWDSVKTSEQGLPMLVDRFIADVRTFFNSDKLTDKQLALLTQPARLNAIIGKFRIEILGGGVMTEQDAIRLVAVLGGDLTKTRNKRAVAIALRDILTDKMFFYNNSTRKTFNDQVALGARSNLEPAPFMDYPDGLFAIFKKGDKITFDGGGIGTVIDIIGNKTYRVQHESGAIGKWEDPAWSGT